MTKQSALSPVLVAQLRDGVFAQRVCTFCGRRHLALAAAPLEAPCRACAARQEPPEPRRGRPWSKAFVAFLATQSSAAGRA